MKSWSAYWAFKVGIFILGCHFLGMGLETDDIAASWVGLMCMGYLFYG